MRRLTAIALLAIALGAISHFWPNDQSSTTPPEPTSAPSRESSGPPVGSSAPAQPSAPASAPSNERAAQSTTPERPALGPVQIAIHAPPTVRSGDTFPVTIELQAAQGVRQLTFSMVYKKSILELIGSSPGAFARQGGPSVQFEEVSDGTVLVRVGVEGGVLAGAGNVAVLEFQARTRGVSPLAIHGVTYAGEGRREPAITPTAYEGSITVE